MPAGLQKSLGDRDGQGILESRTRPCLASLPSALDGLAFLICRTSPSTHLAPAIRGVTSA